MPLLGCVGHGRRCQWLGCHSSRGASASILVRPFPPLQSHPPNHDGCDALDHVVQVQLAESVRATRIHYDSTPLSAYENSWTGGKVVWMRALSPIPSSASAPWLWARVHTASNVSSPSPL